MANKTTKIQLSKPELSALLAAARKDGFDAGFESGTKSAFAIDEKTGLYTERRFKEDLVHNINRFRRDNITATILFIDVNNMKGLNDTYGHDLVDGLLIKLAEVMKSSIRNTDNVYRRYMTGDEFMIILEHTETSGAQKFIGKLNLAIANDPELSQYGLSVSIGTSSIIDIVNAEGVKVIHDPNQLVTTMSEIADAAMRPNKMSHKQALVKAQRK